MVEYKNTQTESPEHFWNMMRQDRLQRGKIDLVGFLLLIVIASAIYAAFTFVPVYIDKFSVSHALAVGCNLAAKGFSDDKVRAEIRERLRAGGADAVEGLYLTDDQIVIDRNETVQTVSVRVDYARAVKLVPLDKIVGLAFHLKRDAPLRP